MDGPTHFREAEQLLHDCGFDTADRAQNLIRDGGPQDSTYLAAAQVHATLALAAEKRKPFVIMVNGTIDHAEMDRITEAIRAAYDDGAGE